MNRLVVLLALSMVACGGAVEPMGPAVEVTATDASPDALDAAPVVQEAAVDVCDDTPDPSAVILEAGTLPGLGGCPVYACQDGDGGVLPGYAPTLCDGQRVLCSCCTPGCQMGGDR